MCCVVIEKMAGLKIFANAKECIRLKLPRYVLLLRNKNGSVIQDYLQMPGCVRLCVYTYIETKSTMCYAEKGITLTHIKKFCDLSVKAGQSELCNLLLCFKAGNILSPSAQIEIDQYLI